MRGVEFLSYILCWILGIISWGCTVGVATRYTFRKDPFKFWMLSGIGFFSGLVALLIALTYA